MADESKPCPSCGHPCVPADKYCSECGFLLSTMGDAHDTLIGKTLPGGYRIVEFIAEGSMGRVYRAEQSALGRNVAVKIMNQALLAHPKMVDRFRTEARAASMLNHPNCMRVYDFGEMPDGPPYLVMELLLGKDLEILLQDEPILPITRILDLTLQILRALEEAHEQGIVHRDLKPANVFVLPQRGGGDLVKVVDFGLAKLKSAISGSTMTGLVCGTPAYMAPEQATGSDTDARTDLYACGVMFFEMLAGAPPFAADDPSDLLRMQVYDLPPMLSALAPDRAVPGIEAILETALAKKREDRYENAAAFAEAIQEVVSVRTGERSHSWVRTSLRSCAECGGLFSTSARFCGECGAPVPRDSLPFGPTSVPTSQPEKRNVSPVAPTMFDRASNADIDAGSDVRTTPGHAIAHRAAEAALAASLRALGPAVDPTGATLDRAPRADGYAQTARPPTDASDDGARSVKRARPLRRTEPGDDSLSAQRTAAVPASPESSPEDRAAPKPSPSAPSPSRPRRPGTPKSRQEIAVRSRQEEWSAGAYDEPDEAQAALVLIEARAASRLRVEDVRGAIALLRRAIAIVRSDVDRGDIDDPLGAMALFTGKLGDALMTAGEHKEALKVLGESLHLTSLGPERVRLLLQMSRAARALELEDVATKHLEDAEREARKIDGRRSEPPRRNDRDSGIDYNGRDARSRKAPDDPPSYDGRSSKKQTV